MSRRSPQEKKRLSHARDRRNAYGENDKSSRSSIRRNKRFPQRSNRHRARQDLHSAIGILDPERASLAEAVLLARRPKTWRKDPDQPLGDHLEAGLTRRIRVDPSDTASASRLADVRTRRR